MSYIPSQNLSLDAFERLRVSEANTLFDAQQEYGIEGVTTWDIAANSTYGPLTSTNNSVSDAGTSVGPTDATTRLTPIVASATNGAKAVMQSRQYARYIPGKGQLIFITGIFADSSSDTASIVLRSFTSGAAVEREIAQPSWNKDTFDGTGGASNPSGIEIDFTKTQILAIDAQWLGVGRVRVGFDIDGMLYPAHEYLNANVLTTPYTQSFNLPVRIEALTDATGTNLCVGYFDLKNGVFLKNRTPSAGGTIKFVCSSVQSEGGEEARGFPRGTSNGITTQPTGTTILPILAIRPALLYNGRDNRAHIELVDYLVKLAGASDCRIIVYENATITGGAWVAVPNSVVEVNKTATAVSGGVIIRETYGLSGGTPSKSDINSGETDIRNPLCLSKIDSLAARQPTLVVAAQTFSGSGTAVAAINWNEQTI